MNIAEIIRNAFPFSVVRLPLTGPDGLVSPHYGLFRDDNSASVGSAVTRKYVPHETDDVVALAEAASLAFGDVADVKAHWKEGHYVVITQSADSRRSVYDARYPNSKGHQIRPDSDVYTPTMIIRAGYDGRAFSASLAVNRMVCRNLLTVPVQGKAVSRTIRHSNSLPGRITDLVQDISLIVQQQDDLFNTIDQAARTTVDMAKFLRAVYPIPANSTVRQLKNFEQRIVDIMGRLYDERQKLGKTSNNSYDATAWEAFNAVDGYDRWDRRRNSDPSQFDRDLLTNSDSSVQRAAALAFS